MLKPDFTTYSLRIIHEDGVIYSSDKNGLRPLIEFVGQYKGKKTNCHLQDRVIGLAAARLIIYSSAISQVCANVMSKKALKLLKNSMIEAKYNILVENILNMDKTGPCPMEKAATEMNNEGFYGYITGLKR